MGKRRKGETGKRIGDRMQNANQEADDSRTLIKIMTIHPLKQAQKIRRVESGRWKKYE